MDMKKKQIIDGLISNEKTCWGEDNREWLLLQDKEILENMIPVPVENDDDDDDGVAEGAESPASESTAAEGKAGEGKASEGEASAAETTENMTVDEYIAKAPDAIQDMLRNGMASHKADKKRLINTITANDQNSYTDEQLEVKSLDELQKIAALAVNSENPAPRRPANYGGQGETVPTGNEKEEALAVPTMNFESN